MADQIREHMEVLDDNHVDGNRIKLARSDASDGQYHDVLLSHIAGDSAGENA